MSRKKAPPGYKRCNYPTNKGTYCKKHIPVDQDLCTQHIDKRNRDLKEQAQISEYKRRNKAQDDWDTFLARDGTSQTRGQFMRNAAAEERSSRYQGISALKQSGIPKDVIREHIIPTRMGPTPRQVMQSPRSLLHARGGGKSPRKRKKSRRRSHSPHKK